MADAETILEKLINLDIKEDKTFPELFIQLFKVCNSLYIIIVSLI